jgi:hypothetical protein
MLELEAIAMRHRASLGTSPWSLHLDQRSPSRAISAKRLEPPKHLAQKGKGHAIAARADIGASSDTF